MTDCSRQQGQTGQDRQVRGDGNRRIRLRKMESMQATGYMSSKASIKTGEQDEGDGWEQRRGTSTSSNLPHPLQSPAPRARRREVKFAPGRGPHKYRIRPTSRAALTVLDSSLLLCGGPTNSHDGSTGFVPALAHAQMPQSCHPSISAFSGYRHPPCCPDGENWPVLPRVGGTDAIQLRPFCSELPMAIHGKVARPQMPALPTATVTTRRAHVSLCAPMHRF